MRAGTSNGTESTRNNVAAKPQSKSGITVWTNINYTNSNTSAKLFCDTNYVKSGLLTGTSWDTVCKWINNSGKNVYDSRTYGNHRDSESPANVSGYGEKQVTGYSEYWKVKNIYDFAGNVWEWTYEMYSENFVPRGGVFYNFGSDRSVSFRGNNPRSSIVDHIGFRIQLYII